MVASYSKEEQLARVRRNQQRCRDRKRAHVEELESQIQILRDQLRDCSPCQNVSPPAVAADTGQVHRENAARRDLLLALGVTEDMQQRFIDSAAQRHAVYAALNARSTAQDGEQISTLQATGATNISAMIPRTQAQSEMPDNKDLAVYPTPGLTSDGAVFALPPFPAHPPLQESNLDLTEWMFSVDTTDWFSNITETTPTGLSIPATSELTPTDLTWSADSSTRQPKQLADLHEARSTQRTQASPSPLTMLDTPMDRCFFETAINFRPGHSSTTCSVAIRIILQHNRRGLSLAELHERMRPGFCAPNDEGTDCRVQDTVFMKLLAEISATDREDAHD